MAYADWILDNARGKAFCDKWILSKKYSNLGLRFASKSSSNMLTKIILTSSVSKHFLQIR